MLSGMRDARKGSTECRSKFGKPGPGTPDKFRYVCGMCRGWADGWEWPVNKRFAANGLKWFCSGFASRGYRNFPNHLLDGGSVSRHGCPPFCCSFSLLRPYDQTEGAQSGAQSGAGQACEGPQNGRNRGSTCSRSGVLASRFERRAWWRGGNSCARDPSSRWSRPAGRRGRARRGGSHPARGVQCSG